MAWRLSPLPIPERQPGKKAAGPSIAGDELGRAPQAEPGDRFRERPVRRDRQLAGAHRLPDQRRQRRQPLPVQRQFQRLARSAVVHVRGHGAARRPTRSRSTSMCGRSHLFVRIGERASGSTFSVACSFSCRSASSWSTSPGRGSRNHGASMDLFECRRPDPWPVKLLLPVGALMVAGRVRAHRHRGADPSSPAAVRVREAAAMIHFVGRICAPDVRGHDPVHAHRIPGGFLACRRRPVLRFHRHRARSHPAGLSRQPHLQLFGIVSNDLLLAIPFFTFMGAILERCGLAEDLLDSIGQLFGPVRGGLSYAVIFVGAIGGRSPARWRRRSSPWV